MPPSTLTPARAAGAGPAARAVRAGA
ncbi:protein-methionine-sulfoxide reductase heme-binding subunit MsrQ, partial [Burkholderia sp. HAN2018]|nr:protein-methionine-sulfoxide reductase heme-binding subunit MsrQ [Burkholderia sp. HAN2018]